jgi:hypothetical protein
MAIESAETVSMEVMDVPYLKVIAGLHVLVEMYDEQVTMIVNEPAHSLVMDFGSPEAMSYMS